MLPIVFHPDYQAPLRANHRFPMSKYGYLYLALQNRGLLEAGKYLAPAAFDPAQIALAHDRDYVDRAFALELSPAEVKRIGLPCTDAVIRRSRLSSSGTTLTGWLALEHGLACNAAGGSHHAHHAFGSGYCVFNDVAVAVRNLLAQGVSGPILIVDTDVHQGDGTAEIFSKDRNVFTFSIHAAGNFPFTKVGSDLDIALPDRTSGDVYMEELEAALIHLLDHVKPRLVFYNAGVDVHRHDRLGRLSLSTADIRRRDRLVVRLMHGHAIPLACVLGGGYARNPSDLAALHAILFEEANAALSL